MNCTFSCAGLPGGRTSEDSVLSPDQRGSQCTFDDMNASDVHGTSLKKSLAQYDCFLDVIITVGVPQSNIFQFLNFLLFFLGF